MKRYFLAIFLVLALSIANNSQAQEMTISGTELIFSHPVHVVGFNYDWTCPGDSATNPVTSYDLSHIPYGQSRIFGMFEGDCEWAGNDWLPEESRETDNTGSHYVVTRRQDGTFVFGRIADQASSMCISGNELIFSHPVHVVGFNYNWTCPGDSATNPVTSYDLSHIPYGQSRIFGMFEGDCEWAGNDWLPAKSREVDGNGSHYVISRKSDGEFVFGRVESYKQVQELNHARGTLSISLQWRHTEGVAEYQIRYVKSGEVNWQEMVVKPESNEILKNITSLDPERYEFEVKGMNEIGTTLVQSWFEVSVLKNSETKADVNGDGRLDLVDVIMLQRLLVAAAEKDDIVFTCANDIDGDCRAGMAEASYALKQVGQ